MYSGSEGCGECVHKEELVQVHWWRGWVMNQVRATLVSDPADGADVRGSCTVPYLCHQGLRAQTSAVVTTVYELESTILFMHIMSSPSYDKKRITINYIAL